ncbi:MAG: HAD family hydrolase [Pseudobdellovibrionaceae bacterium]
MHDVFAPVGPGLVAFDLIGTVVDAGHRYASAFSNVCTANGIARPPKEQILKALGEKNLKQIIDEFVPADIAAKLDLSTFMNDCNTSCDLLLQAEGWEENLYEGLPELLSYMRAYGYEPAIYTGIRQAAMQKLTAHHGLDVLVREELMIGKDPVTGMNMAQTDIKQVQLAHLYAAYEDVFDAEGLMTGHAFHVVGDSPADFHAAHGIGATFYGFVPTLAKREALLNAGVHEGRLFRSFTELAGILGVSVPEAGAPAALRDFRR